MRATLERPYFGLMHIMRQRGITQLQLAKDIGMSYNSLNYKLWGKHAMTFTEARSIAKYLGISCDEIT